MTIYLDIVFLENFILNFIILLGVALLSKSKIFVRNIAISSALGGGFSIINYIVIINEFLNFLFKIGISVIMIVIAFKKSSFKRKFEQIIFFYLVSFTFGGITFMFIFFINPEKVIIAKNFFLGSYPLKMALLASTIGIVLIVIVSKIYKFKNSKKNIIYDLEIFYNGKSKKIKTLLDTGNLLKEPITKKDVIIVEKKSLLNIVSDDILENITSIIKGKWIECEKSYSYNFILIPFSTLGNENGLLIGFKPDYIKIYMEEEQMITNVLIGIYDGKLSKSNLFTSLIGLDILNKEENSNEYFESI